jgi:hypothetical protein
MGSFSEDSSEKEQICHRHLGRRLFNDALFSPARMTKRLLRRLSNLLRKALYGFYPANVFQKTFWREAWHKSNKVDVSMYLSDRVIVPHP